MVRSAADWVPDGAWLAPGYAEWAPPPPLRDMIACLWASVVPEDRDGDTLVLPDGCSDLIWSQGQGAYIAGPDTGPVRAVSPPGTVVAGVRFRPPAGGPALGLPLSELRDLRADLADVLPAAANALAPGLHPAIAAEQILAVAGTLVADGTPDLAVAHAARVLRDPATRIEQVAADVELSERQLRRRFHDAVGYGPKTLQRVYRFQRFVRKVDASRGTCDLAAAASEAGYADQAHLTRDCMGLSGLTPAVLAQARGLGQQVQAN
jgi:methylphosphotriester-DNA--protein-cysteine methyltransferase